eukprot:scaffold170197_cov38-Tisochrysis_lutea.AAC.2
MAAPGAAHVLRSVAHSRALHAVKGHMPPLKQPSHCTRHVCVLRSRRRLDVHCYPNPEPSTNKQRCAAHI